MFNLKRKIILTAMIVVALIGTIVGVIAYVNKPPQESRWDISIQVKNVSRESIVVHAERNDTEGDNKELIYDGHMHNLERFTILGWRPVKLKDDIHLTMNSDRVEEIYAYDVRIEFQQLYGRLPLGVYRISQTVCEQWIQTNRETYYAPFVIVTWLESILAVAGIIILIGVIWYGKGLLETVKRLLGICKGFLKKKLVIEIVVATAGIVVLLGILDYFKADIVNGKNGLHISVQEATAHYVSALVSTKEEGCSLYRKSEFTLEKKSGLIWKTVKPIYSEKMEGETITTLPKNIRVRWEPSHGWQKEGTYRIKQAYEIRNDEGIVVEEGDYYIVFTISP